jgi:hypothetical protein
MSKKHEQRTRAQILAKRATPIMGFDKRPAPITAPVSRSKYTPHIGAKEQERAKRCYMSATFNANGEPRSAPIMHQVGKVPHEAFLEEYESVF